MSLSLLRAAAAGVVVALAAATAGAGQAPVDPAQPTNPHYVLRFELSEFSLLHAAAVLGVDHYGGDADFRIKLVKNGSSVQTEVTILQPRLLEVWTLWMAERTTALVDGLDPKALDERAQAALALTQSVNRKLAAAKDSPLYDESTVLGRVVQKDGKLLIDTPKGAFEAQGDARAQLNEFVGREVRATGLHKLANSFEPLHVVELKPNTLELFTMSQCPFGKAAEKSILDRLRAPDARQARLEVRYIFYRRTDPETGKVSYTALHGDPEVQENLVQIVIRDTFADRFPDYLAARASSDAPWPELLHRVGLSDAEESFVRERVEHERQTLIENEYAYVAGRHAITDGSPTYVWEGERIDDLGEVRAFAGIKLDAPTCAGGGT